MEDPSGDQLFGKFVHRARQLFAGPLTGAFDGPARREPLAPQRPVSSGSSSPSWLPQSQAPQRQRTREAFQAWDVTRPEDLQGLMHKIAFAVKRYEAEGSGYMTLEPRDRVCLKCKQPEAGGETDHFAQYVFGILVGGPSHDSSVPRRQGWFPLELIRFI